MSQTYQARRRAPAKAPAAQKSETGVPGPSLQELAAGAMPSAAQMGRRVDLPGKIREKMESSFGADFSGVKLYESQTVADAGAQAMTMGSNVAFAPGQLDLSSASGQALLGHELSHVVSQAKGESAGRGFLADAGLESQADRQGAMAARGESVYSGPVTPLSASAVPAGAAGPMQAKKQSTKDAEAEAALEGKELPGYMHPIQRSRAKKDYLSKRSARLADEERLRMGTVASDAIAQANGQISGSRGVYMDAARQFMTDSGRGEKDYATVSRHPTRYLESGMTERTPEEQQAMLHAFSTQGSDAEIAPFLIQDIRRYGGVRSDEALSEDDETAMNAYARDALLSMRQADMYDLIDKGFDQSLLVGEGKLTQEEMDRFLNNRYASEINTAAGLAGALQMRGSSNEDVREQGEIMYGRARERRAQVRRGRR